MANGFKCSFQTVRLILKFTFSERSVPGKDSKYSVSVQLNSNLEGLIYSSNIDLETT